MATCLSVGMSIGSNPSFYQHITRAPAAAGQQSGNDGIGVCVLILSTGQGGHHTKVAQTPITLLYLCRWLPNKSLQNTHLHIHTQKQVYYISGHT